MQLRHWEVRGALEGDGLSSSPLLVHALGEHSPGLCSESELGVLAQELREAAAVDKEGGTAIRRGG